MFSKYYLAVTSIFLLLLAASAFSQTSTFTYQGRLTDGAGAASGTYQMQFALYDAVSGGTQIGSTVTNNSVAVANGIFTVNLDMGAGAFPGADRWLEIAVKKAAEPGFTTLSPRQQITSSPYSVRTISAALADNSANLGGVPAAQFVQTGDARLTDARTPTAGSPDYIQNTASLQASSNFNISGNGTIGSTLKAGATALPPSTGPTGVFGTATGTDANGVYGQGNGDRAAGVYATVTGTNSLGVFGVSNNANGIGVGGTSSAATGTGVFGNNSGGGIGLFGQSNNNFGIIGLTTSGTASAIRASNGSATGTAILALGNNIPVTTAPPAAGTGVAAFGTNSAIYGGASATNGVGVVGLGGGISAPNLPNRSVGVAGTGSDVGVSGFVTTSSPDTRWGGYFDNPITVNGYAFVGGRSGGTDYGILSGGVKSTTVSAFNNEDRIMFATEAPEVLFQDFGTGQLKDGRAVITIDPILAANITINEKHPLRVFIQLEDDCQGVFVRNKTANGFEVIELAGGKSNAKFSWQIVANRADSHDTTGLRKDENGNPMGSKYADVRFPIGPGRPAARPTETTPGKAGTAPAAAVPAIRQ